MPRIFLLAISLFALFIVFAVDGIAAGPETRQISLANEGVLNVYARWAASLRKKNDAIKAAEVKDKAKKLAHAFRSPESTYLGFDPSKDLKAYGDSLPGERYPLFMLLPIRIKPGNCETKNRGVPKSGTYLGITPQKSNQKR